ncbi:MAG: hypothetical protein ACKOGE_02260 [Actinomycetota bacterium]
MAAVDALPRPADAEAAGLLDIARVTALAALAREESRGAHFRTDFPEPDPSQAHSPTAQSPGTVVRPRRSVSTPPMA